MDSFKLKQSKRKIFAAIIIIALASSAIYLWGTRDHDPLIRYLNIGIWLFFNLVYVVHACRLAIYPLLTVKNGVLYIAPEYGFKPKMIPLTEIDHIEHNRNIFVNVIGRKYFTNSLTITNKNGKEIHINLGNASDKRCQEIDTFLKNAFGSIQIIEDASKK